LRTYVKHIDLSSPEDKLEDGVQWFELHFLSDKDGDWLQEYLPGLNVEYCENWQKALFTERNWDSVTALIPMLCFSSFSSVKILRIYSGQSEVERLRGFLELAARSQRNPRTPCFSNLSQIHLQIEKYVDFQWPFPLNCFNIKSVSTVSINGLVGERYSMFDFAELFPTNIDPDYFVTSKLPLLNSILNPKLLRRFLPCFYFLKTSSVKVYWTLIGIRNIDFSMS
jgi:hypothetical protein